MTLPTTASEEAARERKIGLALGLLAHTFWGLVPLYFKAVAHVAPLEVLSHRILWSAPFTAGIITFRGRWPRLKAAVFQPKVLLVLLVTAVLVAINWLTFIYAIGANKVLHASLGYYITPLVNVFLGMLILRERLRLRQAAAICLAAVGTLLMTRELGTLPWISLVVAATFSTYGLLRKQVGIDAVGGLFVETCLLAPVALGYLVYRGLTGALYFGRFGGWTTLLLLLAGAVTCIPLLSFTGAARRLRLITVGLLQYLSPSLQFCLAVFLYREPFSLAQLFSFLFIWAGLAVFALDSWAYAQRSFRSRPVQRRDERTEL